MPAERWTRDKSASPYPWPGGPFWVFHDDSITNGSDCTGALKTYPARVAAMNAWTLGSWTNLGHEGRV